ncbi:MAG: hypothetical protein JO319_11500 [Acidobacteriaceae bacterium]|nr:hypothetical protein [Acidobacteriaceae bacterium]
MIDKVGWYPAGGIESTGLPSALPGQGQEQSLTVNLPDPPAPHAILYVWLRGDMAARPTNLYAPASLKPAGPASTPVSTALPLPSLPPPSLPQLPN